MRKLPGQFWKLPRSEDDESAQEGMGRILALSDGVFAIALTLLVLEIAVPATTTDASLPRVLLHLWPRYLAYLLSFVVIARFWVVHRRGYRLIAREDDTLVWLNLLLLLFVAFLPFPTAVVGEHAGSPASAVLYAVSVILASLASAACWWYVNATRKLLQRHVKLAQVRALSATGLTSAALFTMTLPIAAFFPYAAEALWFLAFPLTRLVSAWVSASEREQPG